MDKFWQKQEPKSPLFPDVLWSKPERRDAAGKLAIVGGNSRGFAAVAASYKTALNIGVGECKVILPDALKKTFKNSVILSEQGEPKNLGERRSDSSAAVGMTNVIFAPTNPSGGFARDALGELNAAADWADLILFIGDSGANSETAALLEKFASDAKNSESRGRLSERQKAERNLPVTTGEMSVPSGQNSEQERAKPIVLTRDAVDLIKNSAEEILNNSQIHLVISLSQAQKLFREVYYPRVLTFSQGAKQIAETLHKFTITYPATITLWHSGFLFIAKGGQVISQKFDQPLRVWSGEIATRQAAWQIWQKDPLKAAATSWAEMSS